MIAKNYSKQKSEQSQSTEEKIPKERCGQLLTIVCLSELGLSDKARTAYKFLEVKGYLSNNETWLESAPLNTDRYKSKKSREIEGGKKERCLDDYFITARGVETQSKAKSKVLIKREHKDHTIDKHLLKAGEYFNELTEYEKNILLKHFGLNNSMMSIARIISNGNALNYKSNYKRVYTIINKHTDAVSSIISRKGN